MLKFGYLMQCCAVTLTKSGNAPREEFVNF